MSEPEGNTAYPVNAIVLEGSAALVDNSMHFVDKAAVYEKSSLKAETGLKHDRDSDGRK